MSAIVCGGVGGAVAVLLLLVISEGEPLASYFAGTMSGDVPGATGKLIGYLVKVFGLFGLGAFWVWINKEQDNLRAFQLGITAPALITGMIATYDARDARRPPDSPPSARNSSGWLVGTANAQEPGKARTAPSVFKDVIGGILNEPVTEQLPVSRLPDRFNSDDRRIASDRLVTAYPEDKAGVVDAVIGAIRPSGRESYRINLYAARTLGQIPGGWEGTPAQKAAIEALRDSSNYKNDITFRENVERAIRNWRPKGG